MYVGGNENEPSEKAVAQHSRGVIWGLLPDQRVQYVEGTDR